MFIRFVVGEKHEESGREMGIFMAMQQLQENGELYQYEEEIEKELHQWFKSNLRTPKVQSSESNYYATPHAISWFKSSAIEHIEKMRQYAAILENHALRISQLVTERPGKIVYEDEHQIAAVPFQDTFRART